MHTTSKLCRLCGNTKPLEEMAVFRKGGVVYYRNRCRDCENLRGKAYRDGHRVSVEKWQRTKQDHLKVARRNLQHQHQFIYEDSRRSDKKAGLENDLDREFIRESIKDGCSYCGETELRMTLDRIDNAVGHLRANVVPACIRCNYTRKNMPYEAWLILGPAMRTARVAGLFGEWTGRAR